MYISHIHIGLWYNSTLGTWIQSRLGVPVNIKFSREIINVQVHELMFADDNAFVT